MADAERSASRARSGPLLPGESSAGGAPLNSRSPIFGTPLNFPAASHTFESPMLGTANHRTDDTDYPIGPVPRAEHFEANDKILPVLSQQRQREWLEKAFWWKGPIGASDEWEARKVLGAGAYGIVGRWDYTGLDPTVPRSVVIKQGSPDSSGALAMESKLLRSLTAQDSQHVVKIYKAFHYDHGTGTHDKFDPWPFERWGQDTRAVFDLDLEVGRIYMEFCENGDLDGFMSDNNDLKRPMPEENLWRIFECLAKGILVLKQGTEDPAAPDPNWGRPIVHFDIKPANLLIGPRDAGEHNRFPVIKLADFGLSLREPPNLRSRRWTRNTQWRVTDAYKAPEQKHTHEHPDKLISCQVDVWTIGAVMYELMLGYGRHVELSHLFLHRKLHPPHDEVLVNFDPPGLALHGGLYESGHPRWGPYSGHLIDLVAQCLAAGPSERATAEFLVAEIVAVIRIYDDMAADERVGEGAEEDVFSTGRRHRVPKPRGGQPFPMAAFPAPDLEPWSYEVLTPEVVYRRAQAGVGMEISPEGKNPLYFSD